MVPPAASSKGLIVLYSSTVMCGRKSLTARAREMHEITLYIIFLRRI